MLHKNYNTKIFITGFILSAIFCVANFVYAGNPVSPINPNDNILDPGSPSTSWGGCGPSDSNCYVTTPWTNSGSDIYFNTGNVGIGDSTPSALFTVGNGDLFKVNSSGAITSATGITSSGTITFSGLGGGGTQCLEVSNTGVLTASGAGCGVPAGGANAALDNLASVAINTDLLPGVNDGAALGSATKSFSDLFLASGAVINFNNGDVTLTHSADVLTVAGGDLKVTTAGNASTSVLTTDATQTVTNKNFNSGTNTFPTLNQNTTGSAAKWTTARLLAGNSVDGSGDVAFSNKFIVQGTTDSGLSGAQFLGALGTGILKNTTTTGVLSIAVAGDFPTLNQNTTGSAATLTTPRAIYGNNFDGSAALTQVIASTYGGTGNGFTKFSGPASTEKTFTLPNANATILTDNAVVTVAQGGTNCSSGSITCFNNITGFSAGTTGTTSTNLVFSTSPTLVTPNLGTPTAVVLTNATGTATGLTAGSANNLTGGAGGQIPYQSATGVTALLANGTAGQILQSNGGTAAPSWTNAGAGTVTAVSVATANGFAGSSSGGATPALTLSTTITGVLKGDGTSISAATAGTDYSAGTSALATGILKSTTTTGNLSIAVAGDFPTLNQNTTGSAATLTTARNIYGNSFNGSADLTQVIASTYGGTGNGFTKFTGPASSEKTFTLPNANATILTDNALVTVAQGGTGTNTGSITGTTALTFAAGGTAQNITLTPTTSGGVVVSSSTANTDTIKLLPQTSGTGATFNGIITTADLTGSDKTYTFPNSSITVNAAADISGTTLASNVVSSSLTSVGTITTGVWNGTAIAVANGGTNCTSASITCFNNITGLSATGTTGTTSTNLVFSTSPTLVTPALGAATYTTLSGGDVTDSSLTSTHVVFAGTAGILSHDTGFTFTAASDQLLLGENGQSGSLKIYSEDGATDHSTIFQPGTQTQNITYTLPVDDGAASQVLTTDGSGVLSWTTTSSGGITIGTTTITSGSSGNVLYNNGGVVGEMTTTGSGTVLALATTPTFSTYITTPVTNGSGSANGTLTLQGNNSPAGNTATNANLIFKVGNNAATTAMTILNNGNIGIGDSTPGALLTINGGTSSDQFRVGDITNGFYYKIGRNSSTGFLDFDGTQNTGGVRGYQFNDAASFIISGEAGQSIRSKIVSNSANKIAGVELNNSVRNGGNGYSWYIDNRGSLDTPNDRLGIFNNSGVEELTILSGGNVGIGATNPTSLFSVGLSSQFQVDSSGAIVAVVGISSSSNYIQSAGTMSVTSANTTQTTTSSAFALNVNSLTTGTGLYAASSTLTSGKLLDLSSNGTGALTNQTGLNISLQGTNGTSAQTTYGAKISNTHAGTTSTNVGLYISTSGGTTANLGLNVDAGQTLLGGTTLSTGTLAELNIVSSMASSGSTTAIAGIHGEYTINPSSGGTQVGNRFVMNNAPTSTANTSVNEIIRTIDNTTLANTVRGIEIVSNAGSNTAGTNTGLRATGATFGIQALTPATAGGVSLPAAIYAESTGTTQGDIARLYTGSMTSATAMLDIYHDTSTFTGTAILLDMAHSTGTFSGNFVDFQNASVTKFKVTNAGVVSMGLSGTASTNAVCSSLANTTAPTAGTAYEIRDCNAAPAADYAENYPVENDVTFGDIVTTGTEMVNTYDTTNGNVDWNKIKGKISRLTKSTRAYQENIIGVVSDNYGDFTSAGHNIKDADHPMPVALNGRVPVKISSSSGPISPGDYLTTSDDPGKAAKATNAGIVIGKALEGWDPSSGKATIMMYIEQGYYNNRESLSAIAGITLPEPGSPEESFANSFFDNLFTKIKTMLADATNGITDMFAGTFHAKDKLCIKDTCVTETELKTLIQNSGTANSSSSTSSEPAPEPTPAPSTDTSTTPNNTPAPAPDTTPAPDSISAPASDSTTSPAPTP